MYLNPDLQFIIDTYLSLEEILILYGKDSRLQKLLKFWDDKLPDLTIAIKRSHTQTTKYLIAKDNVTKLSNNDFYYLMKTNNISLVKYLHKFGIIVQEYCIHDVNSVEMLKLLQDLNYNIPDTIIAQSANAGRLEVFKYVSGFKKIDYSTLDLCEVAFSDNLEMLTHLIDLGANVPLNILSHASGGGNLDMVKWLQKKGYSLSDESLNLSVSYGKCNIVQYHIDNEIYPHIENLEYACSCGYLDLVKLLINFGIAPTPEVMSTAIAHGELNIIKYLISIGYSPTQDDINLVANHKDDYFLIYEYLKEMKIIDL
jgi:hypothetical protein